MTNNVDIAAPRPKVYLWTGGQPANYPQEINTDILSHIARGQDLDAVDMGQLCNIDRKKCGNEC